MKIFGSKKSVLEGYLNNRVTKVVIGGESYYKTYNNSHYTIIEKTKVFNRVKKVILDEIYSIDNFLILKNLKTLVNNVVLEELKYAAKYYNDDKLVRMIKNKNKLVNDVLNCHYRHEFLSSDDKEIELKNHYIYQVF